MNISSAEKGLCEVVFEVEFEAVVEVVIEGVFEVVFEAVIALGCILVWSDRKGR
jgi:hypothetical protein